jgi:lysophospholipase L1-like esterase
LPRGSADDPLWQRAQEVNSRISTVANERSAFWLDLAPYFLSDDGWLRAELYAGDQLHLSAKRYTAWGAAIDALLWSALK